MAHWFSRAAVAFLVVAAGAEAQTLPTSMAFSARVADGQVPIDGSRQFTFRLFSGPSGGAPLWEESFPVNVVEVWP